MRTSLKAIFRFLLFMAILTGYGMNSYANNFLNPIGIESSEGANDVTTIIYDNDCLSEDQILQVNYYLSYSYPGCLNATLHDLRLIPDSDFSIWQPPQL